LDVVNKGIWKYENSNVVTSSINFHSI